MTNSIEKRLSGTEQAIKSVRLLDFGLVDKSQYMTLLRQLRKKYAI
ncbi:hypothetical protein G7055_06650 [Streptococcus pyogenes]|nr:hypothetical protein G7055_06650 [Streptococcus pyogenes]